MTVESTNITAIGHRVSKEARWRLDRHRDVDGITVNDIDGVRMRTDDGCWLLWASNTQAILVARCESTSDEGLEWLKGALVDQIRPSHLPTPDSIFGQDRYPSFGNRERNCLGTRNSW